MVSPLEDFLNDETRVRRILGRENVAQLDNPSITDMGIVPLLIKYDYMTPESIHYRYFRKSQTSLIAIPEMPSAARNGTGCARTPLHRRHPIEAFMS